MTDGETNVIQFPRTEAEDPNHNLEEAPEGDPLVVLPYLAPIDRAWHALGKQAQVAFATTIILGMIDIVSQLTTGTMLLDGRTLTLAIAALVLHAALTALNKYQSASEGDKAGA